MTPRPRKTHLPAFVIVASLLAVALRIPRLSWQPIWWDEGYSVYFATEPLTQMLRLTALDIHPPLYYAFLHYWIQLFGSTLPPTLRLASVLSGSLAIPAMVWLAQALYGDRRRVAIVAALLLLFNPMHVYYSQEIRMYGLAMLLCLGATAVWVDLIRRPSAGRALLYALFAAAALYTLYFSALLLFAHAIFGLWIWWQRRDRVLGRSLVYALALTAAAYLPWIAYAAPRLVPYVNAKVISDSDEPLGLLAYLWRHLLAFSGGHMESALLLPAAGLLAGVAALLPLAITVRRSRTETDAESASALPASPLLWWMLLAPTAGAFAIHRTLPFFPEGGERVLLFVLPYFLLLVALGIDRLWQAAHVGKFALAAMLCAACSGLFLFYTMPRFGEDDYRGLIAQSLQRGRPEDTFFAIFPWQVGYWRAYVPSEIMAEVGGPQPLLAGQGALEWGPNIATLLDAGLDAGTVWFPAPLSFGSTLPAEIERYLAANAINLERRWYGTSTRLSAWRVLAPTQMVASDIGFGPLRLSASGFEPAGVASDNSALHVVLEWQNESPSHADDLFVTLRLADAQGNTMATRDYAAPGSLAPPQGQDGGADQVGFVIPAGLAPGRYELSVGVGISGTQTMLQPDAGGSDTSPLASIGPVHVRLPDATIAPQRLPVQFPVADKPATDGILILGHAGPGQGETHLAGEEISLRLFLQGLRDNPDERHLYVSLLDSAGAGVAGDSGWPLPTYPTQSWAKGALAQAPLTLSLPATLAAGAYELTAGLLDPAGGEKSAPVSLGMLNVRRRPVDFSAPPMQFSVGEPYQLGAHVQLLGYDLEIAPSDAATESLALTLHWKVLQTLLPPHHIFVHLDDATPTTLAQDDGPPRTALGVAPSGSWLPGEYVSTRHQVQIPPAVDIQQNLLLRVGLYQPAGNVRLPVSRGGLPVGDAIELAIAR